MSVKAHQEAHRGYLHLDRVRGNPLEKQGFWLVFIYGRCGRDILVVMQFDTEVKNLRQIPEHPWMQAAGFTAMPNALLVPSGTAGFTLLRLRVLLAVTRALLGWRHTEIGVNVTRLAQALGSSRSAVSRALSWLCSGGYFVAVQQPSKACLTGHMAYWSGHTTVSAGPKVCVQATTHMDKETIENKGENGPLMALTRPNLRKLLVELAKVLSAGRKSHPIADEYVAMCFDSFQRRKASLADVIATIRKAAASCKFMPTPGELLELYQVSAPKPRPNSNERTEVPSEDWATIKAEIEAAFGRPRLKAAGQRTRDETSGTQGTKGT